MRECEKQLSPTSFNTSLHVFAFIPLKIILHKVYYMSVCKSLHLLNQFKQDLSFYRFL